MSYTSRNFVSFVRWPKDWRQPDVHLTSDLTWQLSSPSNCSPSHSHIHIDSSVSVTPNWFLTISVFKIRNFQKLYQIFWTSHNSVILEHHLHQWTVSGICGHHTTGQETRHTTTHKEGHTHHTPPHKSRVPTDHLNERLTTPTPGTCQPPNQISEIKFRERKEDRISFPRVIV